MIDKQSKLKVLESIKDKEMKMLVSSVLDKAIKFEKTDSISFTNFLNINELNVVKKALYFLNVKYYEFYVNSYIEKRNLGFIPEYLKSKLDDIYKEHVSCIKLVPKVKGKLAHKDYMGAIYSLGIKREVIGDIIVRDGVAYFFCMKSVEEYIVYNLTSVGRQEVDIKILDLYSDEVKDLSCKFIEKEYIIPSLRVDAILSEVYNLSRSETKEKIVKGDLYINDRNIFYPNTIVSDGDIISFRKCGKLRVGEEIRKTKNLNIVLRIYKYS